MTKEQQQQAVELLKQQLLELAGKARDGSPLVGVEVRVDYSEDRDKGELYRYFFWDVDFTWSHEDGDDGEEAATDAAARMQDLCDAEGLICEGGAVDAEVVTVSGSVDL